MGDRLLSMVDMVDKRLFPAVQRNQARLFPAVLRACSPQRDMTPQTKNQVPASLATKRQRLCIRQDDDKPESALGILGRAKGA